MGRGRCHSFKTEQSGEALNRLEGGNGPEGGSTGYEMEGLEGAKGNAPDGMTRQVLSEKMIFS